MRIKDLGNTATSFASDDYIALDGTTNGSRKMAKDTLFEKTANNALFSFASEFDISENYTIGNKVVANGEFVQFATFHSAGAYDDKETAPVGENENNDYIFSRIGLYINNANKNVGDTASFSPITTTASLRYSIIDVENVFSINFNVAVGGDSSRLWCFVDSDNKVLSISASSFSPFTGEILTPIAAKYVIINIRSGSFSIVKKQDKNLMTYKYFTYANVGSKINTIPQNTGTAYTTIYSKSSAGNLYRIKGKGGSSTRLFMFLDSDFIVLDVAEGNKTIDGFIEAPQDTAWIIVSFHPDVKYIYEDITNSKDVKYTGRQLGYYNDKNVGGSVNINSTSTAASDFVVSICKLNGIKNIICVGEGGDAPRLWAFLDSSNIVLSCSGSGEVGSADFIQVPVGADKVIFQSRKFGKLFLLESDEIPKEIRQDLLELSHPDKAMMDNFLDSDGYLLNAKIPLNLQRSNECAIITIESEHTSVSNPSMGYSVDGDYHNVYSISGKGYKSVNRFRLPPLRGKNAYINLIVEGTYFVLHSINVTYESPKTAVSDCGLRYDAHLGLQALAPENTLVAFGLAAQCGFIGCVTNPIFSADGTGYCYHEDDSTLTLDGETAVSLSAASFASKTDVELSSYKVFGFGSQRTKFLEKIPTLEEYFDLCMKTGMKPVLSTHPIPSSSQLEQIKAMTDKRGLTKSLTIKAFNLSWLDTAFALFGKIDGYVLDTSNSGGIDTIIANMKSSNFYAAGCRSVIEMPLADMSQTAADKVIAAGLLLSTWEVSPTIADYRAAKQRGVSIMTEKGYNCSVGLNW